MVGRKLYFNLFGRLIAGRMLDLHALSQAIEQAEKGHTGEIAVSVCTHAPALSRRTPRERAVEAFSALRVWDTEHNSGVLLFVSLPERAIEIVTDRGAHKSVRLERWTKICADAGGAISSGAAFQSALEQAVSAIGDELRKAFPGERRENQLPDEVKLS